jgi:CheY-like chemotaxis protein
MKRVLFVDDEAPIVKATVRLLRLERCEWETTGRAGGEAALEELQHDRYDALVTDLRMPTVDGRQLLAAARERWPAMLRFVLSGLGGRPAVVPLTLLAHRTFAKPCDHARLVRGLARAMAFAETLEEQDQVALGRVQGLPIGGAVRGEALARLDGGMTCEQLEGLVGREPGLATALLHAANSSFFGGDERVVGVAEALRLLDRAMLRELVVAAPVLRSGSTADRIAARGRALADDAADAGAGPLARSTAVVCEAGLLALAAAAPERAARVIDDEELRARLAVFLLGSWGLPPALVEAVGRRRAVAA